MRMVVTGKTGQVARALNDLNAIHGHELVFIGRPDADLAAPETLFAPILTQKPDIILSIGAYTAVDRAESEPDIAHRINAGGPEALGKIALELDIPIIHLSTDYVFNGNKSEPYVEDDATDPINVYGRSKLAGEQAIVAATSNHVILRTSWVYSPYGQNFVKTMLRLAQSRDSITVVNDQFGCPTSASDIARALFSIAERLNESSDLKLRGLFHMTAPNATSWAGFAEEIMARWQALGGRRAHIIPIGSATYPTAAARPANSRLNCEKLAATYGIKLNRWPKALEVCLNTLWIGADQ